MEHNYPHSPGWKENTTSRDAAIAIEASGKASALLGQCLAEFQAGFVGTADELAHKLDESILNIRPRCSQLKTDGKIVSTGVRRKSDGGRPSHEWQLA